MRSTEIVSSFRQSAPYVNAHRGKTFVIMLGGETVQQSEFHEIINDIALLHSLGIKIVLVYGARPQISSVIESQKLVSQYHKTIRITDDSVLSLIKQVAGGVMLDITARLSMSLSNTPMQGAQINVVSGNFVIAQPIGIDDGVDYHHSGKVRRIDVAGIKRQLDNDCIVVMGPIAASVTGESFNLTAEEVATQVALKLKADKMIGFSEENGIMNKSGNVIAELMPNKAELIYQKMIDNQQGCASSFAFLRAAIIAARGGVPRSHLVSHHISGALLQELFSRDGIGTQIVTEPAERIRNAVISDIGGILELIRPMEEQGLLVRRSREQLEVEVNYFTIIERDGLVIGCAALYPFETDKMGEFACFAVHPEYRDADRGLTLLKHIILKARKANYQSLFALTTRSIHWFLEQGFRVGTVNDLPEQKQALYNYQRNSKILALTL